MGLRPKTLKGYINDICYGRGCMLLQGEPLPETCEVTK